eukprot:scaffold1163_cov101-Isochrysis_galbana.AAC.1
MPRETGSLPPAAGRHRSGPAAPTGTALGCTGHSPGGSVQGVARPCGGDRARLQRGRRTAAARTPGRPAAPARRAGSCRAPGSAAASRRTLCPGTARARAGTGAAASRARWRGPRPSHPTRHCPRCQWLTAPR